MSDFRLIVLISINWFSLLRMHSCRLMNAWIEKKTGLFVYENILYNAIQVCSVLSDFKYLSCAKMLKLHIVTRDEFKFVSRENSAPELCVCSWCRDVGPFASCCFAELQWRSTHLFLSPWPSYGIPKTPCCIPLRTPWEHNFCEILCREVDEWRASVVDLNSTLL